MCLLCTGRRQVFCDKEANKYLLNSPGLTLEVANGSLMTGQARTLGVSVHTYLEAARGVIIITWSALPNKSMEPT
jgi:hypothetical protein